MSDIDSSIIIALAQTPSKCACAVQPGNLNYGSKIKSDQQGKKNSQLASMSKSLSYFDPKNSFSVVVDGLDLGSRDQQLSSIW